MGCHQEMVSMKGLGYKEILDYLDGIYYAAGSRRNIKDGIPGILQRDRLHGLREKRM